MAEEKREGWPRGLFVYGLTVLIVAGLFGGAQWYAVHKLPNTPGSPIRSYTMKTAHGSWVILEDSLHLGGGVRTKVSARGYRVTALDAVTGQKLAQRVFEDENQVECWPGRGAHLWCRSEAGLLSLDLPSLAVRANISERFKGSGAHTLLRDQNRTGPGDLLLLYADGKEELIDSETLEEKPAAPDEGSLRNTFYEQCQTTTHATVPDGYLRFTGGPLHALVLAKESYGEVKAPDGAPTFLRKDQQPDFLDVGDPSLLLIEHYSSLDEATRVLRLSRVDPRGEAIAWTVDLGSEGCEHTAMVARTLVMGLHDTALRAIAIDVDSGKVAWRYAVPAS